MLLTRLMVSILSQRCYTNTVTDTRGLHLAKRLYPKKNRLVIFNANDEHTGTTCTNDKFRAVLNVVYL